MKLGFLFVLFILVPLHASGAPESFLRLYRDAKVNYPAYLASRAEAEAETERENVALGRLMPNVNLSGNYGKSNATRTNSATGSEKFDYASYSYSLSLRQPLFRMQDLAEYRKAKTLGNSAVALVGRADNDLVLGVVNVFFEVLLLNDQLQLLEAQRVAAAGQLASAKRSFELGAGTRIDIDEIQARVDLLVAQAFELEHQRDFRRRELEGYVGRPMGELPVFDATSFTPASLLPANAVDEWVTAAVTANNDYRLLLAQVEAAAQDVMVARSGHFPTLDLVASLGKSANDNLSSLSNAGDVHYDTSNLGIQVNVPLFAGGQVSALVRQAQAKHAQARYHLDEFRARLEREVRREFDSVSRGEGMIRALERAEDSARQSLLAVGKGIRAGVRSTTDLLIAEQQYVAAKVEVARGRYRFLISVVKLKSMAGPVYDTDLEMVDTCFRKYVKND